jgi:endonuclease-3 related protein
VSPPDTRAVRAIYDRLEAAYGNDHWHWYPEHVAGPHDIIVGAILVQHTAWTNAERALEQLREAGALDPEVLGALPEERLIELIRISGTPTVKAKRLRAVAAMLVETEGLDAFLSLPDAEMRERLLATHGVGAETADAIMLYAAGRRTFVIDAYTRRLFARLAIGPDARAPYYAWQRWFEDSFPHTDATMFQRYHAHIVLHGKQRCRATPRCVECPLASMCAFAGEPAEIQASRT